MKTAQAAELKQLKASLKAQEEAAAQGADSIQKAAFGSAIGGKAGMAGLLSILNASDEDFQKIIESINTAGFSVEDFTKKMDSSGHSVESMKTRMEAIGVTSEEFDRALQLSNGNAEDFATALLLVADEGTKYDDVVSNLGISLGDLQDVMDDTCGSAENMANVTQDNLNGQLKILESSLQELSIAMIDTIMPAIRKVVEKVQKFVDWLNSLDDRTKKLVVTIGMIAAAIGPVLLVGGKLSKKLGGLFKEISKGSGLLGKLAKKIAAIGAGPIAAVVAAIAVLIAAFVHLWKNNEDFRNKITSIWEGVKKKFEEFGQKITDTLNKLGFKFGGFGDVVKAAVEVVKKVWDGFCNLLAPVFEGAFSAVSAVVGSVLDVIAGVFQTFASLFSGDWEGFWEGISSIIDGVWGGIEGIFSAAIETI